MQLTKSLVAATMMLAPALVSARPDFYIGSRSGEGLAGSWGVPGSLGECYYMIMKQGQSKCDGTRWNPADGSGGCPGQKGNGPNFCLESIPGYPGLELHRNNGICPSDDSREDGVFYADVRETSSKKKVGRCVYEYEKGPNCATTGSFLTNHFIHCRLD
ncbi:hypothetical protein BDV25DRAFT_139451 [Aspergillus avenaceus]|uniref:Uncharacterized protein n=1 Tax=Aspergillus avenaceus TaxID=36643 RepID=A0A5N6TWU3_ASPAV|nr:hypothetical protein BDV25DRAFT_139451 [Aspergillus avenaceus]